MMKLNERALENVVGGEGPSLAQCELSSFAVGATSPFRSLYNAGKSLTGCEGPIARAGGVGYLTSVAVCSAAVIGAYEGGKHIYKKIKNKLSSK